MACHTQEAIPIATSSTTQLKFSCPNPAFLDAQCYRCSATTVPLMPHLNAVCTVPCILLGRPCLLMPPPMLAAGSPAASLAFTSSKHSPISCLHQPLSQSTGAKFYFFRGSFLSHDDYGSSSTSCVPHAPQMLSFSSSKTDFFLPKSFFILFATIYPLILCLEEETAEEYNCIWKSVPCYELDPKHTRNVLFPFHHCMKSPLKFFWKHLVLPVLVF